MISQKFYKNMTDLISDAQDGGGQAFSYLSKMQTDLADSEILSANIHREKLDDQIDVTKDVIDDRHVSYTCYVLELVEVLQEYIVEKYGSVNGFIRDGGIRVKPTFADISETVGYSIDDDLIEIDVVNPSNIS